MRPGRPLPLVAILTLLLGLAALSAATQDPLRRAAEAAAPEPPDPTTTITTAAPTTTTTEPVAAASFTVGTVDLLAIDASEEFPEATRTQLQELLDRYLDSAIVTPLRTGQPAGNLSSVFAGAALERMDGPDRAALVDEGMPPAQRVKVTTAQADVTALVGAGRVELMTAGISVVVTGAVQGATLTVERSGELLLNADGDEWRVTGYSVRVSRDSDEPVTATTVAR